MSEPAAAQARMVRVYDKAMLSRNQRRYYEDSGFYNLGYWQPPTDSIRQACEQLVDRLAAKIPAAATRILDVACGMGASTQRLGARFTPEAITAINVSETQLAEGRRRAPGSTFLFMDATALQFPDNTFDAVVCVEAAFHFDTREKFLREALRVLKPDGVLTVSDILMRGFIAPLSDRLGVPRANLVPDVASYRKLLQDAGFAAVEVGDTTDICLGGFRRNLADWPAAEHRRGRISFRSSIPRRFAAWAIACYFGLTCKAYLLASARKPAAKP